MDYRSYATEFKARGDKGEYEGYFSVFNNVDDGGDVITAGAFAKTLQERAQPGKSRIKVFFGHDWSKLIGPPPDVLAEDTHGLYAKGRLTLASFWGNEAWQLMRDGALTEGSIGFESIGDKTEYRGDGIRMLKEVKLYEISPVPLGMNPLTEVQAIKALAKYDPDAALKQIAEFLAQITKSSTMDERYMGRLQRVHDIMTDLGAKCALAHEGDAADDGKSRAAAPESAPALTPVRMSQAARAAQMRAAGRALASLQDSIRRSRP
jgi:HK97 family phage prohead protease